MKRYQVDVWVITSYTMDVLADSEDDAEERAKRVLEESHVRDVGGVYEDNWQDVMNAQELTR
jgi:hypothetical protein